MSAIDGFGHQTSARLGCVALAMAVDGLQYVHKQPPEYAHLPSKEYQKAHHVFDFGSDPNIPVFSPQDRTDDMSGFGWLKFHHSLNGQLECDENRVHFIDNCWNAAWRIAPSVFFSRALKLWTRELFFLESLPNDSDIGFSPTHTNVFVHVRLGDTMYDNRNDDKQSDDFYDKILQWCLDHFERPAFHIHSDSPEHRKVQRLLRVKGAVQVKEKPGIEGVREFLQRASQSDVIVMAASTLSTLAATLSKENAIIFQENIGLEPMNWTDVRITENTKNVDDLHRIIEHQNQ